MMMERMVSLGRKGKGRSPGRGRAFAFVLVPIPARCMASARKLVLFQLDCSRTSPAPAPFTFFRFPCEFVLVIQPLEVLGTEEEELFVLPKTLRFLFVFQPSRSFGTSLHDDMVGWGGGVWGFV